MLHALEDIIAAVDRHLVGKEKIAAIERSSPMGLTQLKRYIKMKKETGAIVVGKVGARKKYVAVRAPKKTAAENGFETCGAWPLSLVAMDKHVEKQKVNGVRSTLDIEAWIKVQDFSRTEVLVLPPKPSAPKVRERKRVRISTWHTCEELHAAAARPRKKKKLVTSYCV